MSGELSAEFVRGLQGDHPRYIMTNAGCKHFDAYGGPENIPQSRHSFDAKVDLRVQQYAEETLRSYLFGLSGFHFEFNLL